MGAEAKDFGAFGGSAASRLPWMPEESCPQPSSYTGDSGLTNSQAS